MGTTKKVKDLIKEIKSGKFPYKECIEKEVFYNGLTFRVLPIFSRASGLIGYEVFSLFGESFDENIIHIFEPSMTLVRKRYSNNTHFKKV